MIINYYNYYTNYTNTKKKPPQKDGFFFCLLSEFLLHLLLKEKGIDEFRDDDLIFF